MPFGLLHEEWWFRLEEWWFRLEEWWFRLEEWWFRANNSRFFAFETKKLLQKQKFGLKLLSQQGRQEKGAETMREEMIEEMIEEMRG
ncbi:MAG: hypothetical protein ACI3Y4_01625 [Candidatus Cryptobacteroides sp.]